jgi:hypothetical protein
MAKLDLPFDKGPNVTWWTQAELTSYENMYLGEVTEIDNPLTNLKGFLGESPLALSPQLAARDLKLEQEPWQSLETKKLKSWFIKNVFGVQKMDGLVGPSAVGIELVYRDDDKKINRGHKIHIHSLFPTPEHQVIGQVGTKSDLESQSSFTFKSQLKPPGILEAATQLLGDTLPMSLDASAGLKASFAGHAAIDLSATYYTPLISAMGTGDTIAQWCFYRAKGPLEGHDIPTWTGLLIDRDRTQIEYKARIFIVLQLGLYKLRRFSDWTSLTCELVERVPES